MFWGMVLLLIFNGEKTMFFIYLFYLNTELTIVYMT